MSLISNNNIIFFSKTKILKKINIIFQKKINKKIQ